MRLTAAVTIGLLAAGAAHAVPLCRDLKGLYTPCPPGKAGARKVPADRTPDLAKADTAGEAPAAKAGRPAKPSSIRKGRLCRDSKGLFKPC